MEDDESIDTVEKDMAAADLEFEANETKKEVNNRQACIMNTALLCTNGKDDDGKNSFKVS